MQLGDQIIQLFYRIGPPKKLSHLPYLIWRNFEKLRKKQAPSFHIYQNVVNHMKSGLSQSFRLKNSKDKPIIQPL